MQTDLLKPTYLKELCQKYHLRPSKSYGQNYLISSSPILKMIEAGSLTKKDTIIEIGPGFGVLTLAIAPKVKKVIAFEIEQKLREYWQQKQGEFQNIEIVWGDVLKQIEKTKLPAKYKVLANLPYQITSYILRKIFELKNPPEQIIVMVQKEVADRICAKPGEMSILAVSVQYFGNPKIITKVPRGSFWPSPKVTSAVVSISNIQNRSQAEVFFRFVRAGFSHKRKQLWKNLSSALSIEPTLVKKSLERLFANHKIRAEELGVGDWEKLVDDLG